MPTKTCGERITRGKGSDGEDIVPLVSHTCDLPDGHEGPHSSVSDMTSVEQRRSWERKRKDAEAEERHQKSGLARTQSRPMTSSSMVQFEQQPHPSAGTTCPFCDEQPLVKNFISHIEEHAREKAVLSNQNAANPLASAIPMPPAGFKNLRPDVMATQFEDPYEPSSSGGAQGQEVKPDTRSVPSDVLEAVDFLGKWMASQEYRSRMVQAAWGTVSDYLTEGVLRD